MDRFDRDVAKRRYLELSKRFWKTAKVRREMDGLILQIIAYDLEAKA